MNRTTKSVMAFVLTLLLIASFPAAAFAESGTIDGDSTVDNVTVNVILPTNLNFALDPLGLDTTGDNQIATQDFFFVNQTFAPVKVSLDITAETSGGAILVSTTGGLSLDDTSVTDKELYFGALGATGLTGTAISSVYTVDPDTTYVDVFGGTDAPQGAYASVSPSAATLIAFTPNTDGTTGAAVISFALDKAIESETTEGAIDSIATDNKGVAAFQFYSQLNTYADWEANDITVSGTYTLTPLRDTTYSGYDYIDGSLNQLETAPPAPTTFSVTVENDGNGTATASAVTAAAGDTVTLSATPDTYYTFDSWETTPSSLTITSNTFTMPAENVTVKANFASSVDVTLTDGSPTASYSFSMPTEFADAATGVTLGLTGANGTTITSASWGGIDVASSITLSGGVATLYANDWKAAPTFSGALVIVADGKTYTITTFTGTNP